MREHGRRTAIVLLALAAAGCGRQGPEVSEARTAARAFYTAIVREDWPAAYALLAPGVQDRFGADDFAAVAKRHRAGFGFEPSGVEVRTCDERGEEASALVVVTGVAAAKKGHYRETVSLRKTPAGWRVVPAEGFGGGRR